MIPDFIILSANVSDVRSAESVSVMISVANVAVQAGGLLRHPPLFLVDKHISQYFPRLSACRFPIMPVYHTLAVTVDNKERETGYSGWWRR